MYVSLHIYPLQMPMIFTLPSFPPGQSYGTTAPIWRYVPLPGLLLTTTIIIWLLQTAQTGHNYTGSFYHFVVDSRATTLIIVQIVSFAPGAIHIFFLTTLVSFSTRLSFTRRPASLDRLKVWHSPCSPRMDWTLPWSGILVVGIFLILTLAPPALWAGALTPVVTSTTMAASIDIPVYDPDPTGAYWNRTWDPFADSGINRTAKGAVSYVP